VPGAQTWIGESADGDGLDLTRIRAAVSSEAVALHQILDSSKVSGMMRIRREASAIAARAQEDFKRLSLVAIFGAAIASLSSGLLLYGAGADASAPAVTQAAPAPASPPPPTSSNSASSDPVEQGLVSFVTQHRAGITLIQVIFLLAASIAARVLSGRKLVERWAENRDKAEAMRQEIFNVILNKAHDMVPAPLPAADPGNPIAQALEFFRRYQHELQIRYYGKGAARHEGWAATLTWLTAALAGLAAVTSVIGGVGGAALILSAFLGIAVPILLSAAQSWRATSRDSDKAEAYAKAKAELDRILLDVDQVRAKAALGDAAEVRTYFDSVHVVMTTENGGWIPASKV
jgi:conflict system pore-forming effector with SLATT domain